MGAKTMAKDVKYTTWVENEVGIQGVAGSLDGELAVTVSSPLKPVAGTNPEQLIGLSLATCLNATLQAEEKRQGLLHESVVRVKVEFGPDEPGYQFWLTAYVKIPQVDRATGAAMLATAEQRCPVAKLLAGSANVQVQLVDEFPEAEA